MRILLATENDPLASTIKQCLARFHYKWTQVENGLDAFQHAITQNFGLLIIDFDLPRMKAVEVLRRLGSVENLKVPPTMVLTLSEEERHAIEAEHIAHVEIISRPIAIRTFVNRVQQILHQGTRVCCLGGGTGLFTLLSGLKTIPGLQLCSIVSMSDDGGSTGKLRDMFGILPPGDIRRSLVALSNAPDLLNELMQYRFDRGAGLEGHNLGNLLLTAVSQMRGSMTLAVKSIAEILNIQGDVIPVTEKINTLKAQLENGAVIEGEHRIDLFEGHDSKLKVKRIWQEPAVPANPDALEAIMNAHYVILGPGDLFTSIISNLIVGGIAKAIRSSQAKKIYICNVMTKPGETTDFSVSDHAREIVRYLGSDDLDYVICSTTKFSKEAEALYAKKQQRPVREKSKKALKPVTRAEIIQADVASEHELVRHESLKLAGEIKKIIDRNSR